MSNASDGGASRRCVSQQKALASSETRVFPCAGHVHGQFVRVHYAEDKCEFLTLCEVQVQGTFFREYLGMGKEESGT